MGTKICLVTAGKRKVKPLKEQWATRGKAVRDFFAVKMENVQEGD